VSGVRSAEQEQFAAALHDLLTDGVPADNGGPGGAPGNGSALADGSALGAARRWAAGDPEPGLALWRRLAGLGVTALAVPERCGGLGASPLDLVVACEELGHHALPGPVAESLAAVPRLLAALTDDSGPRDSGLRDRGRRDRGFCDRAPCDEWLRGLATGDLIATLARPPQLPYAADGDVAGLMLLVEGDVVRIATPGTRHQSVDPARSLSGARGGQVVARGPAVARAAGRALNLGTLASAAQLLGAGRALLEASVRHARQRTQFGQPIGAFQAVRHRLADVAIALDFARPLLDAAATTLADDHGAGQHGADHHGASADRDVSAAKVACADAAYLAARVALQVHGAIGYTQEHDVSLWLMKVRALVPAWGTQAEHRARVMAALTTHEAAPWS
jgi:alkylation response protein AidB-like acyl-CoA dehydrogenase